MPSFRTDDQMQRELADLLPLFHHNQTQLLRMAVHELWTRIFGSSAAPAILSYKRVKLAQPRVCAETGIDLPAGTEAWQAEWTDGRVGDVYSQIAMDRFE